MFRLSSRERVDGWYGPFATFVVSVALDVLVSLAD